MLVKVTKFRRGGGKLLVMLLAAGLAVSAMADGTPDALTFITGGGLGSTAILSTNANSPDTVFAGVSLDDYEPAYAYFNRHNPGGNKWSVCYDLEQEILRPYNVVRATENGASTMTVQFQGVTRTHRTPYTASITIKFLQSGSDVKAYVVRAASLKPLDIELGLDLDAMVDGGNQRVVSRPLTGDGKYNISVIAMRKPGAAVSYAVHDGDSIGDTLAGNGAVIVTNAAADVVENTGYLPNNSYVVVAENHDLADLDEVEGFYHTGPNSGVQLTACQFKYTSLTNELGRKTCQFQGVNQPYITCIRVRLRQNGANVEAETDQWANHYMDTRYGPEIYLGMDFEKYVRGGTPDRGCYNNLASDDSENKYGIKDLTLKFRSRPTVAHDGYLPNGYDEGIPQSWTVVAENHKLSDLVEVEAFYHLGKNTGIYAPGLNLKISGNSGSCQFQRTMSSFIKCIGVDFRQNGNNIEASTGRYRNWHIYYNGASGATPPNPEVVYGMDFYNYGSSTVPKRNPYGAYGAADDASSDGIKNLRLRFATGGITYAVASTAQYGNDLTFAGSADVPLAVKTAAATVFPSNGVVTVAPYATLTLNGHVGNDMWTQYRVMTNGTLAMTGTWQTKSADQIDLVGGTLSLRECDAGANDSGTYISYVTLMNGACVRGKPARVGHDASYGNWIVAGDSPSYCESGMEFTAAGGDTGRTFALNVNDVAEGSDFVVTGDIVDYGTMQNSAEYWNVHVIKDGAGTMEVSGDITLPNEICVSNGVLRLTETCTFGVSRKRSTANGDGSEAVAEIWLAGGALETAEGATNAIGKVVAKAKDSPLNLGDGAKLTLSAFEFEPGANLLVSDNLGDGATLHVDGAPTGKVFRGIRCGADRKSVMVDENGNLVPWSGGLRITVK